MSWGNVDGEIFYSEAEASARFDEYNGGIHNGIDDHSVAIGMAWQPVRRSLFVSTF